MIILLPLLRKLSIRSRAIAGSVLTAVGLLTVAVAVVAMPSIVIHGAVTAIVGLVFLGSAWSSRRRRVGGSGAVIGRAAAR